MNNENRPKYIIQLKDGQKSPEIYGFFDHDEPPYKLMKKKAIELEPNEQLGIPEQDDIKEVSGIKYKKIIYKIGEKRMWAYIKEEDFDTKFFKVKGPRFEDIQLGPKNCPGLWHIKWTMEMSRYLDQTDMLYKPTVEKYQEEYETYIFKTKSHFLDNAIHNAPKKKQSPIKYNAETKSVKKHLDFNSTGDHRISYADSLASTGSTVDTLYSDHDIMWESADIPMVVDQRIYELTTARDSANQHQIILYPILIVSAIAVIVVIGELLLNCVWSMLDEAESISLDNKHEEHEATSDSITIFKEKQQEHKNSTEAQHSLVCSQLNKFAKCHKINRKYNITAKTLQAYLVDQKYWIQNSLVVAITSANTSEVTTTLNSISPPQCLSRTTTIRTLSSFTITAQQLLAFTPSLQLPARKNEHLTVSSAATVKSPVAFSAEYASSRSRSRPIFIPYTEECDSSAQSSVSEKTNSFGSSMYALLLNLKKFRKADELTKKKQPKQLS